MMTVSKRFKDRPHRPVDTAIWWIQYILRHDNSHEFMMPLSANQYWFQKRLLDAWLFIAVFTLIYLYVSYKVMRLVFSKCCTPKKGAKSVSSRKKRD